MAKHLAAVGRGHLLFRRAQERVLGALPQNSFDLVYRYRNFAAFAGRAGEEALELFSRHPDVERVGLDLQGKALLDESRPFLGADRVHDELSLTGAQTTIAVLDSGIDSDHPDLRSSIADGAYHFNEQGGIVGEGAPDRIGHGTAVAGVITSDGIVGPRGIAPQTSILAVKVLDDFGLGWESDWLAGIDYVISVSPEHENLVAINMSIGAYFAAGLPQSCPCDNANAQTIAFALALDSARAAGILTFAASGNSGFCGADREMSFPACVSSAIAVGACYDSDVGRQPVEGTWRSECEREFPPEWCILTADCFDATTAPGSTACWSSRTDCLEFVAPGHSIVSSWLGGGTIESSGTSFSSPHAAAVAALLSGRCITPQEIVGILERSARATEFPCSRGDSISVRVLNAYDAVALAEEESPRCEDCNRNLRDDAEDIRLGTSLDCDENSIPDECQADCDHDGVPDRCEIREGAPDCDGNGVPDECDVVTSGVEFSEAEPVGSSFGAELCLLFDADDDGHQDLITLGDSGLRVYFRRQERWEPSSSQSTGTREVWSAAAADFDGDGDLDLAVGAVDAVHVGKNNGGRFGFSNPVIPVGERPTHLLAVDLDGDGDPDLVSANLNSDSVSVLFGAEGRGFEAALNLDGIARPVGVSHVDLDGDGTRELVAAGQSGQVAVFRQLSDREFAPVESQFLEDAVLRFQLFDIDGDRAPELVYVGGENDVLRVRRNDGRGAFGDLELRAFATSPHDLSARELLLDDLDRDGRLDLLVIHRNSELATVFRGERSGLAAPSLVDVEELPAAAALANLDGDELPDLAVIGGEGSLATLNVFRNLTPPASSQDCNANRIPDECEEVVHCGEPTRFVRGDVVADSIVNLTDAIAIFASLFLGKVRTACSDALDVDATGSISITDGIFLLNHLFAGGPAPRSPYPDCGTGDEPQDLGCERYEGACL